MSDENLGLIKGIINEKIVREITKVRTNAISIVREQLPKKNSSKKDTLTIIGTKLGPIFTDEIAEKTHAKMVKHSRKKPLE